jgi:phosphoenolpyruvate carboxykinase (ATP)
MPIKATRALLTAALNGSLRNVEFRTDKYFGFAVPTALPGVDANILDPVKTWANKAEFDKTARALVGMFQKNFAKFEAQVDADVRAAAPEVKLAAE